MKKILVLIFALVFVFALSACDKKNEKNDIKQEAISSTQAEIISRERAIELVLNHAGLTNSDIRDLETELDRERGDIYWEIDFESKNLEYSYDVNAQTEEIIKLETERE